MVVVYFDNNDVNFMLSFVCEPLLIDRAKITIQSVINAVIVQRLYRCAP